MANIITDTDFQNVALAISAYSDEAYTNAKKLGLTIISLLTAKALLVSSATTNPSQQTSTWPR